MDSSYDERHHGLSHPRETAPLPLAHDCATHLQIHPSHQNDNSFPAHPASEGRLAEQASTTPHFISTKSFPRQPATSVALRSSPLEKLVQEEQKPNCNRRHGPKLVNLHIPSAHNDLLPLMGSDLLYGPPKGLLPTSHVGSYTIYSTIGEGAFGK